MFLTAVEGKEKTDIVKKCKYKTSADCNDIHVKIVSKVRRDLRLTNKHLHLIISDHKSSKQNETTLRCVPSLHNAPPVLD